MERNAFLSRIRDATARGRAYPVPLNPEATADQAYVGGGDDPVATFLREWSAVGGKGVRAASLEDARSYLRDVIELHSVRSALCWPHPVLERFGLEEFLQEQQVEVRRWDWIEEQAPVQRWEQTFSADLGITSVDWAVAETGTQVLASRPGRGRSVSLLPPVHVTIVEPAQIVPDLFDLFGLLDEQKDELPSSLSLITGPSKTGDIQLKLTTGVHGPKEAHVIVVDAEF